MSIVDLDICGEIAVIRMNQLPVNSLGIKLRQGILDCYRQAVSKESVKAIVITAKGKIFCGGADISEFGTELAFADPSLPALCEELEASSKILVAAVNGLALGGGFELALACDYRIALPVTKMGLPEVNLGLLPGAGGTQRLPRIANVELALEMIVTGKPIESQKLYSAGVIDRIHDGDELCDAAILYAKELVENGAELKSCTDIAVDTSVLPENFFETYRNSIARRSRGFYAPERCIQAIEAACTLPFKEGLEKEWSLFNECMDTPQARAQQHLFFAERAASKIPGVDPKTSIRDIKKVAVIGSGTMGGGIAMNFINAGIETIILDLNSEALERGIGVIQNNFDISLKRGSYSQEQVDKAMALLQPTTEYSDIADADLVIEAVFEKMELKKRVFETVDQVCKPDAILATNTSTLDVNEIASVTQRPEHVVGLHFFSPANVMRLLEVVRSEKLCESALMSVIKLAQKIKKVPVVSGVCWGFIGNRMLEPYGRESARLILEGASPAQIDKVHYDLGMAMGFPSMIDLVGMDVSYLMRQGNRDEFYTRDSHYAAILDELYELGRYGQKTGRGFYIYKGRDKQEDPEVMELATDLARQAGVEQRAISDQEILERTIFMLINEGAKILDEGIACRSGDIDVVFCNGYGFPGYKGGPMQYADEIGLDKILAVLNGYREKLDGYGAEWFKPAPLIEKLVAEGKTFASWSSELTPIA